MQRSTAGWCRHNSEAFIGGVLVLTSSSMPVLYSGVSFWTEMFSMAEYGATVSTIGGLTHPHALDSAGSAATIPLNVCPFFRSNIDCSRDLSEIGLLLTESLDGVFCILFEYMDEISFLVLIGADGLLLCWITTDAGKGSTHEAVRSKNLATCPLLIPNRDDNSKGLKLSSTGRPFSENSSLSAYWIRARSCR